MLAFAISWAGCLPVLAATWGLAGFQSPLWLGALVFMALGPALAAGLTLRWQGEARAGRLRALFRWHVAPRWFLVALAFPGGLLAGANSLSHWWAIGSNTFPLRGQPYALFLLLSLLANPWEEVGWRGFALPRLQAHYAPVRAALVVGLLWGLWHLPLFLLRTGPVAMGAIPFGPWFLAILGRSYIMT